MRLVEAAKGSPFLFVCKYATAEKPKQESIQILKSEDKLIMLMLKE